MPFAGNFNSNVEPVVAFISTVIISFIAFSLADLLFSLLSLYFSIDTQDDLFSLKMGVLCVPRSSKEM